MSDDGFDLLVEKYFEGRLTAEESARFAAIVAERPDAMRDLLTATGDEYHLRSMRRARAAPGPGRGPVANGSSRRTRPFPRRRMALAATGLFAVTALALALFQHRTSGDQPSLECGAGACILVHADGSGGDAAGGRLRRGDAVTVADGLSVILRYPDRTTIACLGPAQVQVGLRDGDDGAKFLRVTAGRLSADVSAQTHPFRIETANGSADIIGTRFSLTADAETTRLVVDEGRVRLTQRTGGRSVVVGAGEHATVADGLALSAEPAAPGLRALYRFFEGSGAIIHDVSGVGQPADLSIGSPGSVGWLPGHGLGILAQAKIASEGSGRKLVDGCRISGAFTLLARIRPRTLPESSLRFILSLVDPATQQPLVQVSQVIGDDGGRYIASIRTSEHDVPSDFGSIRHGVLQAPVSTELAQLALTRDETGMCRLFLDGEPASEERIPGDLSGWEAGQLVLATWTRDDERIWLGEFFELALYDRALDADSIRAHASRLSDPSAGRQP